MHAVVRLACLIPLLGLVGCGSTNVAKRSIGGRERVYRDVAGWAVDVPSGWHVARFSESKGGVVSAGAEFSNARLAIPTVVPGSPVQVNGQLLPANGVSLIISTDADPSLTHRSLVVPPLPAPHEPPWSIGSALAGEPYLETLWFRANGQTFIASAKVGSKSDAADLKALAAIVSSLRYRDR